MKLKKAGTDFKVKFVLVFFARIEGHLRKITK